MGGKLIAGIVGFVLLVIFVQNFVLGGGGDPIDTPGATSGLAPTATLPAQLPEIVVLGEAAVGGNGTGGETTGGGTYVVVSGDTLGSIAASFNVPPEDQAGWIAEILEINGLPDARLLQAGQELIVPTTQAAPTTPTAGATPGTGGTTPTRSPGGIATATPTAPSGGAGGSYTVVSGDTPLDIAEKLCVEGAAAWVNELVALNDLNPNNLTVGDELELPAGTSGC